MWYTREGTIWSNSSYYKSQTFPLIQGWLEISWRVKVGWPLVEKLSVYITIVEEIKKNTWLLDNSKEIFKELVGLKAANSHDDDEDEGLGNTKDENCEVNEIME